MTVLQEFYSTVCPHCQRPKQTRMTFCPKCYFALPLDKQRALYKKFGEGYEEAFQNALLWLERES